jgi:hypothetical protein
LKDTPSLAEHDILVKPHHLSDIDPFNKLLNNNNLIDELLSDPEVVAIIQHYLTSIKDNAHPAFNATDDFQILTLQSEMITPEELALGSFPHQKLRMLPAWASHQNETT